MADNGNGGCNVLGKPKSQQMAFDHELTSIMAIDQQLSDVGWSPKIAKETTVATTANNGVTCGSKMGRGPFLGLWPRLRAV